MGDGENKELIRAKNAAYRLLTFRPRSRKELEDKLRDREFPADVIASVIEHCTRLGYLDDAKFAREWAAGRVRTRGHGRLRIEQELRRKGIDRGTIRTALAGAITPEDEREAAVKAAEKKLRTLKSVDRETRKRRLAGFLARKGFSPDVISGILRTVR